MLTEDDLTNYPQLESACENAVKILISAVTQEFFVNPELEFTATVDDGSQRRLTFERIDV